MRNPSLFSTTQWHTAPMVRLFLMALLLTMSWLVPFSRALWDHWDLIVFQCLNRPIAHSHTLALFWAFLNMRPVDALFGIVLFSFILRANWTVSASNIRAAFIALVLLLIWLVVIRIGFVKLLNFIDWSRASPSMTIADANLLTRIFPGWAEKYHLKDGSPISFPGDHASVLIIWAMFISRFVSHYKRTLVWGIALALSLPRLAAGAHWLSDDLIGGLVIALVAYATAMDTPLLGICTEKVVNISRPLWHILHKLPLIGHWAIFAAHSD